MAKHSKRRTVRRGSKRKRKGGDVVGAVSRAVASAASGLKGAVRSAAQSTRSVVRDAERKLVGDRPLSVRPVASVKSAAQAVGRGVQGAAREVGKDVRKGAAMVSPRRSMAGGAKGGSGKCCFPAKFCGSRKLKGNKRRRIKSGRCCLPVSSKRCSAKKKKSGRNTRRKPRSMFGMFGGG
jgi:hypothetical protein